MPVGCPETRVGMCARHARMPTRRRALLQGLFLGLLTVIEWPKDLDEPAGRDLPAFQRDTTNVYLVTSRDGRSIDDEWVYAHQPLLIKGATQKEWDAGFVLPASGLVHTAREHLLYYEVLPMHAPRTAPSPAPACARPSPHAPAGANVCAARAPILRAHVHPHAAAHVRYMCPRRVRGRRRVSTVYTTSSASTAPLCLAWRRSSATDSEGFGAHWAVSLAAGGRGRRKSSSRSAR